MKDAQSQSNSYIIRIWREEGKPGWQGWVQHARTRESAFFQRLDELLDFVERHSGKVCEPPGKGLK